MNAEEQISRGPLAVSRHVLLEQCAWDIRVPWCCETLDCTLPKDIFHGQINNHAHYPHRHSTEVQTCEPAPISHKLILIMVVRGGWEK